MTQYEERCEREDEEDRLRATVYVYRFRDMVYAMILALIVGFATSALVVGGSTSANAADRALTGRQHECIAPCVVVLPPGTLEDEFAINYGWKHHRPQVQVWTKWHENHG